MKDELKDQIAAGIEAAKQAGACEGNLNPITAAFEAGDYLTVWQGVLGNRVWLEDKNIKMPKDLERLAKGIGKTWHSNGQLAEERTYKNGNLHGVCKRWHSNGQLEEESTYKSGKLHGAYKSWDFNWQLYDEATYKDGKLHGAFQTWHINGSLLVECSYKDGKLIK